MDLDASTVALTSKWPLNMVRAIFRGAVLPVCVDS